MRFGHRYVDRNQYLVGLILYFTSYGVYLTTLPSTVTFGDSGDFITTSYVLGIPHPSGYPLYTLINHLFSYIPLSNIGMRITLSSAIFASLTVTLLYFLQIKLSISSRIAFFSSLAFAFSHTFFRVAGYSKTYALYGFLSVLLIFILALWQKSSKLKAKSHLYLLLFILGLSFTNHNLTATIVPGILAFVFAVNKNVFADKEIVTKGIGFFVLGLLVYLYLPIRAAQNPPIDWANPTTLQNFIDCISVKFAQKRMFDITLSKIFFIIKHHSLLIAKQFLIFGIISFFGIYLLHKLNRNFFYLLLLIILVNTSLSLAVYTDIKPGMIDYESYHIPSFLSLAVGLGVGLNHLAKKRVLSYLTLLIPAIICVANYYFANKSRFFFAYDYARNLLKTVSEEETILFTYTDHEFMTLWYLRYVENRSEDLIQLNLYDLTTPWVIERIIKNYPSIRFTGKKDEHYLFKLENLVRNNIDRFKIYYTFCEDMYNPGYKIAYADSLSMCGILFRVEKKGRKVIEEISYLIRGLDGGVYKTPFTRDVLKIYAYAYGLYGTKHLASDPKRAKEMFEKAVLLDPENESYRKGIEYCERQIKNF